LAAAHVSIAKAAQILGLQLVQVPVDDRQWLREDELPDDLSDAVLVLTAGTVTTGAIDPLDAGHGAAWRHVDAAWAGPLRLSCHAGLLDGIEVADSVAVSAHKWLYQPKECALVLFADPDRAHHAISFGGGYLAAPNVGLVGSHANTALPLAATLLAWGRTGIAGRIEADMTVAERLADLIVDAPELQLCDRPVTGVVNWRPVGHDPAHRPCSDARCLDQPRRHRRRQLVPLRSSQPTRRPRARHHCRTQRTRSQLTSARGPQAHQQPGQPFPQVRVATTKPPGDESACPRP